MADIGQVNKLRAIRQVPFGLYLDGGPEGEILLPNKFKSDAVKVGDEVEVFIFHGSDDELIATTQRPRAYVGQFAYLKVTSTSSAGAFLDWGLSKDLLVPFPAQKMRMTEGQSYVVYVTTDEQGRVVATSKIDKFLDIWPIKYEEGQQVSLLICEHTDIGYKAIIDNRHWGLIHETDVFKPLRYGKREIGYIKKLRDDDKIDLSLRKTGMEKVDDLQGSILAALERAGGFLPLHDKSSPDAIKHAFGESKKSFKAAIGGLYKRKMIEISEEGISLKK